MRRLVTGRRAKEIDAYTMNVIGIPSMVLMERAALGVARMVQEYFQEREHAGACAIYRMVCRGGLRHGK